ncbi:MAG TPA: SDR family oxidoreductase [Candidatus Acidoferrales bacterium]|nr:SDR family oxidoreductase [Candidatus Acidoferrales bacterium]
MTPRTRRALVTGGASGLSAGIAAAIAAQGFERVAITYRSNDPAQSIRAIESAGARASATRLDFHGEIETVAGELERLVAAEGPFDTLVHGVGELTVKRFVNLSLGDYARAFDANTRSGILAARAVLPAMREAGFGRIVFFGGFGSSATLPFRGFSLHQAAKSALVAFARVLAIEEASHGITVNVVEPGDIRDKTAGREEVRKRTSSIPRGRPGSFEDIADVVCFLVAPERDFVTGAVIAVTGGLTQADGRNAEHS